MENLGLLIIGVAIGIAASAPVGAVNIMSIQRALRHGFAGGLSCGIGAVVADALFATVAGLGLAAVDDLIDRYAVWFQLIGGSVIIVFGVHSLLSHPTMRQTEGRSSRRASGAVAAFTMTITNPGAAMGIIALFGTLGDFAPEYGEWIRVAHLVGGVVAGALLWWTALALGVTHLRERLTDHTLEVMSRVAGSLLILFGVVILGRITLISLL